MELDPARDASRHHPPAVPPTSAPATSHDPVRPLEESLGAEEFERRLLALALDPAGGGARRAWILAPVGGGRLAVARELVAPESPEGAGVRAPLAGDAAATPPEGWDPLACGPAVAEAWRDARPAWTREGGPPSPWSRAGAVGAASFRPDRGPERLLVAAWDRGDDAARDRFLTLADRARLVARVIEAREAWRVSGEQRVALVEWIGAAASAHHLSEGLRLGARAALRVSGADVAAIWTVAPGRPPVLAQTAGEVRERESVARALQSWANETVERAGARTVGPASGVPCEGWRGALEAVRGARLTPIVASGQVLGVLATVEMRARGAAALAGEGAGEADTLLAAVADGLALLLDRAASAEARRAGERQERELRARLRRRERLANVGERAAGALAEARQPLASIGAFARRAHRELAEGDPRREYLEVILRESERLERLVAESAEPAAVEPPQLRMESVNAVLQDVLPGIGERLVRRRVRLLKRLDPESPALLLDSDRIRQVFRNILERAVDGVPVGGRVRVESRLVRDHVIAEIAFDGGRSPGDLLEELFVPFTPGAARGAPGLGVADRIIRQHGGEVRVRADGEWGAAVLITLPVRDNEERRRARGDRRVTHADRRAPARRG